MAGTTQQLRYGGPAIALHWLIALLIFGGYGLGVFMHDLPASPQKLEYYSWHKWGGVTVFILALLRAGWRVTHPAPKLADGTPVWQRWAAEGTHVLLYLLLFAIPLSGWLHSSALGYQTVYFGVLPLPDLLDKNKALADWWGAAHEYLNYGLLVLLLAHVGAALMHHFIERDDILRRILPKNGARAWALLASAFGALGLATLLLLKFSGESEERAAPVAAVAATASSGDLIAEFRQMGVAVEGRFTSFRFQVQFDPAQPESGQASIEIDTASFDIGDAEYNSEVAKPEWLDAATHPKASFVSSGVKALDGKTFEAVGQLSLKGRTQEIRFAFTAEPQPGAVIYSGSVPISRAAYGIGDASWNDVLEDTVTVKFRISVPNP